MWKGIETKSTSQYFLPVVTYFQNLPFQWSGHWSMYLTMQFKYRMKPLFACEKNCSNLISAIPMLNLQQHSVSVLSLFAFRFFSFFPPLLLSQCLNEHLSLQFAWTRLSFRRPSPPAGSKGERLKLRNKREARGLPLPSTLQVSLTIAVSFLWF